MRTPFFFGSLARFGLVALVVLIALGVILFAVRLRREPADVAARTTAIDLGMAAWLALILLFTVVPYEQSGSRPALGLIPFIDAVQRVAKGETSAGSEVFDVVINVILFLPLGIGAGVRWGRSWRTLAIVGAAAVSMGIELAQALEASGRFASFTDVVTNTTGSALGFAIGLRLRGPDALGPELAERPLRDPPTATEPPRSGRLDA